MNLGILLSKWASGMLIFDMLIKKLSEMSVEGERFSWEGVVRKNKINYFLKILSFSITKNRRGAFVSMR